jgi:hypothetical protein
MSFRTDLLNNTDCDHYLEMGVPPITEWDPDSPGPDHKACAESGDGECCVASRGEDRTSRVWEQTRDMSTHSVAESFDASQIVGTAVHTSRVAAVGNFNDDDFPDIVIGNRLYLNRQWTQHLNKDLTHATSGVELTGNFRFESLDECTVMCMATARCNSITHYPNNPNPTGNNCFLNNVNLPFDVDLLSDDQRFDVYILEPTGKGFDHQHGLQIGPRDFAQVYAGDVDGIAPDDVVAVYENGEVEVFLTSTTPETRCLRLRAASASTRSASCSARAWPP